MVRILLSLYFTLASTLAWAQALEQGALCHMALGAKDGPMASAHLLPQDCMDEYVHLSHDKACGSPMVAGWACEGCISYAMSPWPGTPSVLERPRTVFDLMVCPQIAPRKLPVSIFHPPRI